MRLYKWRGPNQGTQVITPEYTWVKRDESVEVEINDDITLDDDLIVTVQMTLNVGGRYVLVNKSDIPAKDLLGKTISLTYNSSYSSTVTMTVLDDGESTSVERRHVKEAVEYEDDFEIPETIEHKRETPDNQLIVVNETNMAIKAVTINYRYKGNDKSKNYLNEKLHSGDYTIIELPEELKDIDPNMYCTVMITLDNGRYTQIQTRNVSDICGKVVIVKYDEETRYPYNEVH